MGNVTLGGSKRQSYSPGDAPGKVSGQGATTASVPANGSVVKTGANGQATAEGAGGKHDVTGQHDVIVADNSGSHTRTSPSVPATPIASSPASPASPQSPAEKKTKRRVPRFVFSLRRTGSGKSSRKPRAGANGVRPVSYPAALGASGSNPAYTEKSRPQSLLFEEITIPEDDGKIETVSLSSNEDYTEKKRSKEVGENSSAPTSTSPKTSTSAPTSTSPKTSTSAPTSTSPMTSTSKKEKKKESSPKKPSKKKKDKESKSKTEKHRKGSKDKGERSPEKSPQETPRTYVEEDITAVVSLEENQPSGSNEVKVISEEVVIAASVQTQETLPDEPKTQNEPKTEKQLVQEVMVAEAAILNEQTPESTSGESEPNSKAEHKPIEPTSSEAEWKESLPEETLIKQVEEIVEVKTELKQEENPNIKQENKTEDTAESEEKQENGKSEENVATSSKTAEGKPEEDTTGDTSKEPKLKEAKPTEVGLPVASNLVREEIKEEVRKETVSTEELVEMVLQPSVAAVAHTEMKAETEESPETEQTTLTAASAEALPQREAETEQQKESQMTPDSLATISAAVVQEKKTELKPMVTEREATKDTENSTNSVDKALSESVHTVVTQKIVTATQESIELTQEPAHQETVGPLSIHDGEDFPGNKRENKVIVEEVVEDTVSAQVQADVHAVSTQPMEEATPEQDTSTSQPVLSAENNVPENEADDKTKQKQASDQVEETAAGTAVTDQAAEGINLNPPTSFIPEEDTQPKGEHSPPLSPSQIKALEKERRAAKKKEEKEKAKKEKEEKEKAKKEKEKKKRQKELNKQESKDKKQKEKEEKEGTLREINEKGKGDVAENTEAKAEEIPQDIESHVTDSAPSSPARSDVKQDEQLGYASQVLVTDSASTCPTSIEMKQEGIHTAPADTQTLAAKTEVQPAREAEATQAPSINSDNTESSSDTKAVEAINVESPPTECQDTETPCPSSNAKVARQSTSSASSSSDCSSGPPTPATPQSPFGDPQSPDADRSGDSAPTSPRSSEPNETTRLGSLKKIALRPRLRTAILRKSSSGAESEENRVSLTQPRFVQTSQLTPPPRKQRPRRPLEQVWSPLGDYARNRALNAKSSAHKEAGTEEAVTVAEAVNSESACVDRSVKTEDASASQKTEAADIAQPQHTVTTSGDTDNKSTSAPQKIIPESETWNVDTLEDKNEESMTVSVSSSVESVPKTSALQSTTVSADVDTNDSQGAEKTAFVFDTSPHLSSKENTVKTDNDSDYKVMCDLSSPGSRVSIHSDPSSPTVVSVASIVLSGQPDNLDILPPSDSPHQPPEFQKLDEKHREAEPKREAGEAQNEQESNVLVEETVPQETDGTSLQALAAGMVSQANEDAQVEVVKLISEDKGANGANQHAGDMIENMITKRDTSDNVGDEQGMKIEEVNVNCDRTDLTNTTADSRQHCEHSEVGMVRGDDKDMVCAGSDSPSADCEESPSTEENKAQQSEVAETEGCVSSVTEDVVSVAVQSVVSKTENQLDNLDPCVGLSDLKTDGASNKVEDGPETTDCPKNDISHIGGEPESSSHLESSETTAALQTCIKIPPQSEIAMTIEKDEEPPSGTPCVLIPEEVMLSLKMEAESSGKELMAGSECKGSTENDVRVEVENSNKDQASSSVSGKEKADHEDSATRRCIHVNDHDTTAAVVDNKVNLQSQEPSIEATVEFSSTLEKNSGEALEDQQHPKTQPELEQRSELVQMDSPDTQHTETPAEKDVPHPSAETTADVPIPSSGNADAQHLNGDRGPEDSQYIQAEDKRTGGEREGETRLSAQCNGSHVSEVNSNDTIDAYLKL
ncbi:hypothetical protein ACOMHN_029709 [Nucella lapillus]